MTDLWRDWFVDNPFLKRDLRRWSRRGYGWKLPLVCAGFPALLVLFFHGLAAFGWPEWRRFLDRPLGLLILSLLSILHAIIASTYVKTGYSLIQEATAERLEFIRLLPLGRRDLMVRLGIARGVLWLPLALLPLPIYALLLCYGVSPDSVAGLYLIFAACLFVPPGFAEVNAALTARRGSGPQAGAVTQAQQMQAARSSGPLGAGVGGWIVIQWTIQFVLGPTLGRMIFTLWRRGAEAAGPYLGRLLPFSFMVVAGRLLWVEQPFYRWMLAPAVPFAVYWALRMLGRVVGQAEVWSREPEAYPTAFGRNLTLLSERTGRENERGTRHLIAALSGAVLCVTLAGLLWRQMALTGALGYLAGMSTPAGAVAALLVLFGFAGIVTPFERLRTRLRLAEDESPLWREAVSDTLRNLIWTGGVALLVCAFGQVSPWPEAAISFALLAAAAGAALVFAAGWREVLYRNQGDVASRELTAPATGGELLHTFLWMATYVAPMAVLSRQRMPDALHYLSAASPIYGFCTLLPGLWQSRNALPLEVALAIPTALGTLGLLLASRSRKKVVPAARVVERRDPIEIRLANRAAQVDNPILTLALVRIRRRPIGVAAQAAFSFLWMQFLPLVLITLISSSIARRTGASMWELMSRPAVGTLQWGGVAACIAGLGELLILMLGVAVSPMSAVALENVTARQQGRMHFLLISGITDRQIVTGVVGSALLASVPFALATGGASLTWMIAALTYGAPPWLLGVWLWGIGVALVGSLHLSFRAFGGWKSPPKEWFRRLLRWLRVFVVWGAIWLVISQGRALYLWVMEVLRPVLPQVLLGLAAAAVLGLIAGAALLPCRYRRALADIYACRVEDDMERAK